MNLDRVTITGADDLNKIDDLVGLTKEFPFVEWGILVSRTAQGNKRFPTRHWILEFISALPPNARLSMHVCGQWVRDLLRGITVPELEDVFHLSRFQRMQLNFHAEKTGCLPSGLHRELLRMGKQFIFQIDGARGNAHLEAVYGENLTRTVDAVPLFDLSGGAGILPTSWPKPMYYSDPDTHLYHGYAGGLGPGNIATELPRIAEAAGDTRFWIDMERRVRSEDDQELLIEKVRGVLEYCAPFVVSR